MITGTFESALTCELPGRKEREEPPPRLASQSQTVRALLQNAFWQP